jgi:hypothetical protein
MRPQLSSAAVDSSMRIENFDTIFVAHLARISHEKHQTERDHRTISAVNAYPILQTVKVKIKPKLIVQGSRVTTDWNCSKY